MTRKLITKNILFGFLTWLIPFAISFLFYKPGGKIVVPYDLFKSIMIVVASTTGCYFLYRYFKNITSNFIKESFIVGITWFVINIILDIIVLMPIMKVSFSGYMMAIGLRYLIIPVIAITLGYSLNQKTVK